MGLLSRLFAPLTEKRALSDAELISLLAGGAATSAGPVVNEENALRYSAVYAAVQVIAGSLAGLPLRLMRQDDRLREPAIDNPLYGVLHDLANSEMTAFDWRELMFRHVLVWGNGYSEIEFDTRGRVVGLWPLLPDKMEDIRRNPSGQLEYHYRLPNNSLRALPKWRIHHIKGPGNALIGFSPIRNYMRESVGLGLAVQEFGARFFGNGARPGGILEHPGKLSDQAHRRLANSWGDSNGGLSNSHRLKILEEGMKYNAIGVPPEEAQFLETRKFQVTEIARFFNIPPHKLKDLERATFGNIEHQSLEFVQDTLLPWIVRHEQAIYRDLLSASERIDHRAKYIVNGLLRGDFATRTQGYSNGINAGWMTRNEARELEDMNPIDGLDEPLSPLNMVPVGAAPPPTPAQARSLPVAADLEERAKGTAKNRLALMNRHIRLFEDAAERVVKREVADIRKAVPKYLGKRSIAGFGTWLASFYEQLREWLPEYFSALMLSYAETILADVAAELDGEPAELDDDLREWIERYLENFTAVYAVGGEKQLRTLLAEAEDEEAAAAAIEERLTGWEETKAQKTGLEQAFEAGNALSVYGYIAGGVSFLRWAARGDSCPLCKKMDGKRIRIGGAFLDDGDEVTAEGTDPLPIVRKIKHGPLHSGCDCVVIAG